MDIKRFPEKMGDLPIDFSNPKRTLISGLFQETAKVGGQPRKFLTYIPEDLDYTEVFDTVLKQYTKECELVQVKTTNMGSLFRLTYNLKLKNANEEKNLIDELRCRNGNLEITVSRQTNVIGEL